MKVTIILLCLLVIGLTIYIVYDKVLSNDNDKCVNDDILNENGNNNFQDK